MGPEWCVISKNAKRLDNNDGKDNDNIFEVHCNEGYQNDLANILEYYIEAMLNFKLLKENVLDYQTEYKRRLLSLENRHHNAHQ